MAYAALVELCQIILHHVTDGDQNQINFLHEKMWLLQTFLEEYASNGGSRRIDLLEGQIKGATYRAKYVAEQHISNHISSGDLVSKSGGMEVYEKRYYKELERMIEEIDFIVEEVCRIEDPVPLRSPGDQGLTMQAPSYRRNTVVGFDNDLIKLKDGLCGESTNLRIISIVGMGGIGKTTLAKTIFDDSFVTYHFDVRTWITISQEFCMRDILLGLVSDEIHNDLRKESDEYWLSMFTKV